MKESFAELKRLTFFLPSEVFVIHGIQWFETLDYSGLMIIYLSVHFPTSLLEV